MLFGAVALTGVLAAVGSQLVSGPITTITRVTQKNMADTQMLMNAKILVSSAVNRSDDGDADGDGTIEPASMRTTTGPKPVNGGLLPSDLGLSLTDPWGSSYGYCVWNHGTANGGGSGMIAGVAAPAEIVKTPVIAVIAAGPDKAFQTTCSAGGGISKAAGSDDYIFKYTYAEATSSSNGLWQLDSGDKTKAQLVPFDEDSPVAATINRDSGIADFVGIVTGSVTAKTDVITIGGGLKLDGGVDNGVCTLANKGTLRIKPDPDTTELQVCNGTIWVGTGSGDLWVPVGANDVQYSSIRGGNVGIGIAAPTSKLHVVGTGTITGDTNLGTDAVFVNALNKRVGINTVSPTAFLDVNMAAAEGTGIYVQGTNNPGISINAGTSLGTATANAGWSSAASSGDTVLRAESGSLILAGRNSSGSIIFTTGGTSDTEKMRLSSGGNLGIGMAPGGVNRLDVSGSAQVTTDMSVGNDLTVVNNMTVDTNTLFVDAAANRVGIGTVTPNVSLEVLGTASAVRSSYDATHYAQFNADSSGFGRFGGNTGSGLGYFTGSTFNEVMRTTTGGFVAIGQSAANARLDVAGGIRMGTDTTCNSSKYGTLRWNTPNVEFCSTTGWRGVNQIDKLDDIGDVDAASPNSGQALIFDGTVWKNRAIVMGDISDGVSPAGNDGSVQFKSGSSLAADAANFHWDDSNNRLGIGTNTPLSALHVQGAENNGTTAALTIMSGTQKMIIDGNEIDSIGDTPTLALQYNNTNNVTIAGGGGSVAVGSGTVTPSIKLDVAGRIRALNEVISGSSGAEGGQIVLGYPSTSPIGEAASTWNVDVYSDSALRIFRRDASNNILEGLKILENGNVGLGVTTPLSKLHVSSSGYAQFERTVTAAPTAADCDAANEAGRQVIDTANRRWYTCLGASGWAFAKIGTSDYSGSQWLQGVDPGDIYYGAGNVGIGTDNPEQPLDIAINDTGYFQLTDTAAAGSAIRIGEGWSSTAGVFAPVFSTYPIGTNMPLTIQASLRDADDTGTSAGIIIRTRKASNGPTVRPALSVQSINSGGAAVPYLTVHGDGKVSVGNITPTAQLDVNGDLRLRTGVIQLTNDGATNSNNDYVVLDDSNNLYFAQNPMSMSLVGDNPRGLSTTAATGSLFARYGYFDRSVHIGDDTANACTGGNFAGLIRYNSGKIQFCNGVAWSDMAASGAATAAGTTPGAVQFRGSTDALAADDLNFFWDNTNKRLGIGTASPLSPLHVSGSVLRARFNSTSGSSGIIIKSNDGSSSNVEFGDAASDSVGAVSYFHSDDSMRFTTNGTAKAYITSAGNVGIGNAVSTPLSLLHVGSAGYFQAERSISSGAPVATDCDAANETGRQLIDTANSRWYTCTGTGGWQYTTVGTAGGLAQPGGTDKMVQFNDGGTTLAGAALLGWDKTNARLGVGTLTPAATLHSFAGAATATSNLRMTNNYGTQANYEMRVYNAQSGYSSNALEIWGGLSGSEDTKMVVTVSGKVGIGSTNPLYDLSLNPSGARTIGVDRNLAADTAGNNLTVQAGGATASANNKNGGNLYLNSGISTGTGTSNIYLQTAPAGSSGTGNNSPSTAMSILGNNFVGINTASPTNSLTVWGPTNTQSIVSTKSFDGATAENSGGYIASRSRSATVGTSSHPLSGDRIGYYSVASDNGGTAAFAGMAALATEAHSNTAKGMRLILSTTPNGTVVQTSRVTLDQNGNFGIGAGASTPLSLLHVDSAGYPQFAKTFAGAPTAGDCAAATIGRQTIDTTNGRFYVCTGASGWQYTSVGSAGGASNAAGTVTGVVQFRGANGLLAADDANLVFDDTNNRLGVGTAAPMAAIHVDDTYLGGNTNYTSYMPGIVVQGAGSDQIGLTVWDRDGSSSTVNDGDGTLFWGDDTVDNLRIAFRGNNTALSEKMRITSAGNVGIGTTGPQSLLHVGTGGYFQTEKTFAGAPTAADCDAAAELGRQTIDTTNGRFYICSGTGGWKYTNVATTGGISSAAGSNTQIQYNDNGVLGATASFTIDAATKQLTLDTAANGATAFAQTAPGFELFARDMTTTNKYTPFLKFGSSDTSFTTTQPKTMAAIAGEARDNFAADANGAMDMVFFTATAATTPVMTEAFRITNNNRIAIGGVTAPTFDIGILGNAAKSIGMERNSTASTAGQNLTLQAGGIAASGTLTNLNGGNLVLSSGISTGTGSSNIIFNTPTPTTTGATVVNPTQSMILLGASNYLGVDVTTPRERLELSKGHLFHTGGNINHYFNTYYDSTNAVTKFAGYGGTGYAASVTFTPSTGNMILQTSTASGAEGATATLNSNQLSLASTGRVGVGGTPVSGSLQVFGGTDVTVANTTGVLVVGANTGEHLAFDGNELQARNSGAVSAMHINTLGGNVVVGAGGAGNATLDVAGGVKVADYATCAAGGANNGTIRYNSSKIQFCLSGVWTDMAASGSAPVPGTNTQMLFNDGGSLGAAANLLWDKTYKHLTIDTAANGTTASFVQTAPGLELFARDMTTTNKYTPYIKFGSSDTSFTTAQPKTMATIVGEAQENYAADTNGGMDIVFHTALTGATPALTEAFRITSDNKIAIGGQAAGSTYDIAISNTAAKTIAMERNSTASGVGNSLTVQAGGVAASGTLTNLNGGNLQLASGISTGTGSSNIFFQTPTPAASGATVVNPTTKMTLSGAGNLGIGTAATAPLSALSVAGNGGATMRAFVVGMGTTSGTYGLVVRDSGGATSTFYVRDDGMVYSGSSMGVNGAPSTNETAALINAAGKGVRVGPAAAANDGTAALLVTANAAAQRGLIVRAAASTTSNIFSAEESTGSTSYIKVTSGGQVGINYGTSVATNAALDVNGGIKVGDNSAACVAGGANNGTMRWNSNKVQFCLAGTWTDMAASGNSAAGGSNTQIQYNASGILAGTPSFTLDAASKQLTLDTAANGITTFAQTSPGFELFAREMTTTNKYTPFLKFGSSDANFTTNQPKTMAAIAGEAIENYTADANGGMDMIFFTAGTGVTPSMTEAMRITSDNRIVLGGQTAGSTYDIALTNTGTTGKTIGMERNVTAAGAGNSLTVQAGGVSSSGTITNKAGGNLILSSGLSTGTGSSSIVFNTATPSASGATVNTPTTSMTLDGNGILSFPNTTTDKIRLYSSSYGFGVSSASLDIYANGFVKFRDSAYAGTAVSQIATIATNNSYINAANVGIGTTNPLAKLDVNGTLNVGDGAALRGVLSFATATGLRIFNQDNSPLYFGTNNTQRMYLPAGGGVIIGTGTTANATLDVAGGVKVADYTTCVAGGANNGTIRFNSNKIQFCLAGAWTDMAASGASNAGGATTQVQFNDGGTTLAGAVNLTWDKTYKHLSIDTAANGSAAFTTAAAVQNLPGYELMARAMTTTNKYTPAIKFGSSSTSFTTTNPKFNALIVGEAQDNYNADANGAMDLVFFTGLAGTAPVPSEAFRITSDNKISIGGQAAGSTYDIALYNTSAKTIAMERNATASTAGQNLTLQAGGAAASGTLTNLAGGTLNLSSGIATGSGGSNINFLTATPNASGVTVVNPSSKMTILGNGNVGINTATPAAPLHAYRVTSMGSIGGMTATGAVFKIQEDAGDTISMYFDGNTIMSTDQIMLGTKTTGAINFFTADTQRMGITNAGLVGIGTTPGTGTLLDVGPSGYFQAEKVFAGAPTAGDCAAATIGRQTIDTTNGRFYVCTGATGWKYTAIGTAGGVGAAAGSDKQIQYNNAGALAGAVNFTLDPSTKQLTLDTLANGATAFAQTAPGLELFAKEMTTTNKFTPFLKFGSTDAQFTTVPQKTMIAIGGEAQDSFTADTSGAMDLVFFTATAAATPAMTEAFRITSDNKISIGGATAGSTYDIALYNTGTTGKVIGMERNATSAGAGNSLTIQAGGVASAGTITNKAGGNLILSSGISAGTGASNILLQTATPGASGATLNTPSTAMTILGTNKVGVGTTATAPTSLLSVGGNGNASWQAAIHGIGTASTTTYGLVIRDSGSTNMFWTRDDGSVYVNNNLGVGVTPVYTLDVYNTTALGTAAADTSIISQIGQSNGSNSYIRTIHRRHTAGSTWTGTNMRMQKVVGSTAQGFIDFGIDGLASDAGIGFGSNATTRMVLTSAGYLGVANTSPSYQIDVTGTIRATSVIYTSDARSKVDIRPLTGDEGLDLLAQLNPVHYKWKDKAADQGLQWGLIAQEVEKVMPSIVTTDNKGMKAVDYRALTPVLIKAVQQLNEKNKQLEARLDAQQKVLDAQQQMLLELKAEVEALKATRH